MLFEKVDCSTDCQVISQYVARPTGIRQLKHRLDFALNSAHGLLDLGDRSLESNLYGDLDPRLHQLRREPTEAGARAGRRSGEAFALDGGRLCVMLSLTLARHLSVLLDDHTPTLLGGCVGSEFIQTQWVLENSCCNPILTDGNRTAAV